MCAEVTIADCGERGMSQDETGGRSLNQDELLLQLLRSSHPGREFSTRAAAVLADTTIGHVGMQLRVLAAEDRVQQTEYDRFRVTPAEDAERDPAPHAHRASVDRVLTWYVHTATAAAECLGSHFPPMGPELSPVDSDLVQGFSGYADALRWFDTERENLAAGLHVAVSLGLDDLTWQIPVVLRHFYAVQPPRDIEAEWVAPTMMGLEAARRLGVRCGEADLLESLGMACVQAHRTEDALHHHREGLVIRRELGDEAGQARSLNGMGLAYLRSRQLDQARAHFEQALEASRRLGDRRWEGIALGNLADTVLDQGDLQQANDTAEKALEIHRDTDNKLSECACLLVISSIHREWGQPEHALAHVHRALDIAVELDNRAREAYVLVELGKTQLANGDLNDALMTYHQAAVLHRQLGDIGREAHAFDGAGQVYDTLGRPDDAEAFYRRAIAGHRKNDDKWHLAISLDHLAATLAHSHEQPEQDLAEASGDSPRRHWQDALNLLADVSDPEAAELRSRIHEKLSTAAAP